MHGGEAPNRGWTIEVATLQRGLLWVLVASGASACIEPSPYEFMFLIAMLALGPTAMRFHGVMIPMIVLLALYNAGGMLSLILAIDETRSITFISISNYMALTATFFAGIVAKEPNGRMATIRSAYVASGVFASALAVLGYFDVLASASTLLSTATFARPVRSKIRTSSPRFWRRPSSS
jgi:hypothetical protein